MLSLGLTGATSMFAASYMDTAAINLNLRNVTIEQAFKAIEEQSEFSFFYNEEEVSSDQRISIHVKDKGITEVLNQLLNRNDIAYKITDRHIVLYRKTDKAETNQSSQISQKHITVKDHRYRWQLYFRGNGGGINNILLYRILRAIGGS